MDTRIIDGVTIDGTTRRCRSCLLSFGGVLEMIEAEPLVQCDPRVPAFCAILAIRIVTRKNQPNLVRIDPFLPA